MKQELNEEILDLINSNKEITDMFLHTKTVDCRKLFWSLDEDTDTLFTNTSKNNFYPSSKESKVIGLAMIINLPDLMLLIDDKKTYILEKSKEVNMKIKPIDGNIFCNNCGEYLGRVYEGLPYIKIEVRIDGNEVVCDKCGYGNITYFNYR